MLLASLASGDALAPLRPFAAALSPFASSPEVAFVLGLAVVQLGGAFIGMVFAYFFARFFAVAAPIVALPTWGLIAAAFTRDFDAAIFAGSAAPILATLGYGLFLAAGVP